MLVQVQNMQVRGLRWLSAGAGFELELCSSGEVSAELAWKAVRGRAE